MKSSQKIAKTLSLTVAAAAINHDPFDMTNFKGASIQLNKTGAATASAKIQWSLDGSNWEDVPSANGGATKVVAAGTASYFWNVSEFYMGKLRLSIDTVALATLTYEYYFHAKAY